VGDAPQQGPAQERIEPLTAQPTPANSEVVISDDKPNTKIPSAKIKLVARTTKPKAAEVTAVNPEAGGLVTAHPKPAKRLNAKDRAKAKMKKSKAGR